MREAAKQDERREQPEKPSKAEIVTAPGDQREHDGNREIRKSDADVRQRVGPDQPRLPKQAEAVRRQTRRVEKPTIEQVQHTAIPL